jgi:hypothetical protein
MHAIQARDAVWRRQRAATAARLPPRDAHVKAWRVARLQAVGEEARAAVRCAEAARDAIELTNRELAAARASDQAEILQLRELIETSAVDQAELLRLRGLTTTTASNQTRLVDFLHQQLDGLKDDHAEIKTSSSDQDARLCTLEKAASSSDQGARRGAALHTAFDEIHEELDRLNESLDFEVGGRKLVVGILHSLLGVKASKKSVDELSARVDRIVQDMGEVWGQKWQRFHEFENWR